MPISDDERLRREHDIKQTNASWALEGLEPDPAVEEISAAYARGEIDENELMRRTRAVLGLPETQ
jgi:hypothetical protein